MKLNHMLGIGTLMLSLASGSAFAQDKAAKQAEIGKVAQASLNRFYKAKPELKSAVSKAPGYAVFTTYGFSFVFGGEGGKGLAHDNKSNKNTYMAMAGASVGAQLGASESEVLMIFKTASAYNSFVDKGWSASGGVAAGAGANGKTAGGGMGSNTMDSVDSFTLTKTGLEAGMAIQGSKFWKPDELN
ncbi:MAG: YSC84-related protein [Rubrivivax sp.]